MEVVIIGACAAEGSMAAKQKAARMDDKPALGSEATLPTVANDCKLLDDAMDASPAPNKWMSSPPGFEPTGRF